MSVSWHRLGARIGRKHGGSMTLRCLCRLFYPKEVAFDGSISRVANWDARLLCSVGLRLVDGYRRSNLSFLQSVSHGLVSA